MEQIPPAARLSFGFKLLRCVSTLNRRGLTLMAVIIAVIYYIILFLIIYCSAAV